jgi:hypothetical protein
MDSANRRMGRRALLARGVVGTAAAGLATLSRANSVGATDVNIHTGTNLIDDFVVLDRRPAHAVDLTLANSAVAVDASSGASDGQALRGHVDGARGIAVNGATGGDGTQIAIYADSTAGLGQGISMKAKTKDGTAIWAECTGGNAIDARGPTVFSRSGHAVFTTGTASKAISGFRLTNASLVLAIIQANVAKTYVRGVIVDVPNQKFTIYLNRAAPKNFTVGWFIVN